MAYALLSTGNDWILSSHSSGYSKHADTSERRKERSKVEARMTLSGGGEKA